MTRSGLLLGALALAVMGCSGAGTHSHSASQDAASPDHDAGTIRDGGGTDVDGGGVTDSGTSDTTAPIVGTPVSITAHPSSPGLSVPRDFLGVGYETSAFVQTKPGNQLDPASAVTQQLLKNLAPAVVRIGGNSVDTLCGWTRSPRSPTTPTCELTSTDVDAAMNLARKVGYRVIWSVNLKTGTASSNADQVSYIYGAAASVINQIAIGNEPNLFGWSTSQYISTWSSFESAIVASSPGAHFAGWDQAQGGLTGGWAATITASSIGAKVGLLTNHLYALQNWPTTPTISDVLSPELASKEISYAQKFQQVAATRGVPWRITETADANGGTTPASISNTFAAALWAPDYMYLMASYGAAGVNFHCGRGGAFPPGPIQEVNQTVFAEPVYYGILLFRQAAKGRIVPLDVVTHGVNLTAYATLDSSGTLRVTVINKDPSQDAAVTLSPGAGYATVQAMRLTGPGISATHGVQLGGASVAADGTWSPAVIESASVVGGHYVTGVPAASAVVLAFAK